MNDHVEGEFGVVSRGKKHTRPSKEPDIVKLAGSYRKSKIYAHKNNRTFPKGTAPKDFILKGMLALQKNKFFKKWHEKRAFPRSTLEISDSEEEEQENIEEAN